MNMLFKYFSFDSEQNLTRGHGLKVYSENRNLSSKSLPIVSQSCVALITVRNHSIEIRIWMGFWIMDWYSFRELTFHEKLREKCRALGVLYILRGPSTGFQRSCNVRVYVLHFFEFGLLKRCWNVYNFS